MPRPKEFDEPAVLTAAMHTFRRLGYRGVSIRDLETETNVTSGSLYHTYGDKHGIFAAALAHYRATVVAGRIQRYLGAGNSLAGLRDMFASLLREPDGGHAGCLLTNSAIEFADESNDAGVLDGFDQLERAFEQAIARAALAGDLRADTDVRALALRLLVFYQGILVLVRSGSHRKSLGRAIDAEFDQLEREHR
jgi:AcrR family transcriptional regulator